MYFPIIDKTTQNYIEKIYNINILEKNCLYNGWLNPSYWHLIACNARALSFFLSAAFTKQMKMTENMVS